MKHTDLKWAAVCVTGNSANSDYQDNPETKKSRTYMGKKLD